MNSRLGATCQTVLGGHANIVGFGRHARQGFVFAKSFGRRIFTHLTTGAGSAQARRGLAAASSVPPHAFAQPIQSRKVDAVKNWGQALCPSSRERRATDGKFGVGASIPNRIRTKAGSSPIGAWLAHFWLGTDDTVVFEVTQVGLAAPQPGKYCGVVLAQCGCRGAVVL